MQSTDLKEILVNVLDENKGLDIKAIDVTTLTNLADYFIISSATSNRHAKALADKVVETAKGHGVRPLGVEGEDTSEWILIDLADIVVHVMLQETREFYSLEKLWQATEETRKKVTE